MIVMKQMIILAATIMLGVFLYGLIAGPQDGSIYSEVKNVWQKEIDARTMTDH